MQENARKTALKSIIICYALNANCIKVGFVEQLQCKMNTKKSFENVSLNFKLQHCSIYLRKEDQVDSKSLLILSREQTVRLN